MFSFALPELDLRTRFLCAFILNVEFDNINRQLHVAERLESNIMDKASMFHVISILMCDESMTPLFPPYPLHEDLRDSKENPQNNQECTINYFTI